MEGTRPRLQTIADVNPRINHIKYGYLRNSLKTISNDSKLDEKQLHYRRYIQERIKQARERKKINLSCQGISTKHATMEATEGYREAVTGGLSSHQSVGRYR
jgi:hypothetical protein